MNEERAYTITFVRHGESIGNAEGRLQGQADFPLSDAGRAQAQALADRWHDEQITFDAIITSPLTRALETGQIIGRTLNAPVESDPLWLERDNGKAAGMRYEEIRERFPAPAFQTPFDSFGETGEGDWELYLRAGRAVLELLHREPGNYLVVSHGGILNKIMYVVLGITPQPNYQGPRFRFENTSFARVIYFPDAHRWRVDVIGDQAHLRSTINYKR
jgi:broad specificity phosphatase PhoE